MDLLREFCCYCGKRWPTVECCDNPMCQKCYDRHYDEDHFWEYGRYIR